MLNRQTLAIIVPILVLLLPMSYALAEEWQKPMSKISLGEVEPQTESAVRNLIEANQILKRASNSSTYVAAGSVVDVVYKLGQNGGIRTYANISIAFPIKGDLALHEISTVWYEGGEFGEWSLTIYRLYPYFPGDAVTLPSVFELRVGMSILFFAFQQSDGIELLLYVLVPSEYLLCNNPVDSNRGGQGGNGVYQFKYQNIPLLGSA